MSTAARPLAVSAAPQEPQITRPPRLESVDLLRGIIMAVMALDHVRDFFTHLRFPPTDMTYTYAGLFFTRWVTHYSAPTFFFLAGVGAYLSSRHKPMAAVSRFLWTRGLALIVMEFTVVWWGWTYLFSFPLPGTLFLVIWQLGASMIVLSLLIRLPIQAVAAFGIISIFGHDLLDNIQPGSFGRFHWLWREIHWPSFLMVNIFGRQVPTFIQYVLVPWTGVMAAGFALGQVFTMASEKRRKILFVMGCCAVVLFVVLRATNFYGNPAASVAFSSPGAFQVYPTMEKTIISFFNVEKYPPSLQYLLMTLGPGLIFLAITDQYKLHGLVGKIAKPFLIFGKVPMFFYLLHLYLIHAMAIVSAVLMGQPWRWLVHGSFFTAPTPQGYGHGLPFIWMTWMIALAILYLPCRWYAEYKATHKQWWLSYL